MSNRPANTEGLAKYRRVIVSKRSAQCEACERPTQAGRDFAAVDATGQWHGFCAQCAQSPQALVAGVVNRVVADQDKLTADQVAAIQLPANLSEALAGTLDVEASHQVYVAMLAVAAHVKRSTTPTDGRIVALRNLTPKAGFESNFIPSVLDQYDRKGRLSEKQWAIIDRILGEHADPTTGQALPDLDNGLYLVDGDVWRLYTTQGGHQGARRLDTDRQTFDYVRGGTKVVRKAVASGTGRALTGPEAAAMGRQYGFCVACARDLSDDVSIAMGIGPVCAAHLGLPRISEDEAHRVLRGGEDAEAIVAGFTPDPTWICDNGGEHPRDQRVCDCPAEDDDAA